LNAHVGLLLLAPAERANCWSWRKRSSVIWPFGVSVPISSRNSVPPRAIATSPGWSVARAGEGAAAMAEQLVLDQQIRQRAAVDRDEGPWLRAPP